MTNPCDHPFVCRERGAMAFLCQTCGARIPLVAILSGEESERMESGDVALGRYKARKRQAKNAR